MALGAPGSFGAQLKTLREAAGDTQEEVSPTVVLRLMHDLHEHAEQEARAHLGAERWAAAYAAGRRSLSLPTRGTSPFRSAWSRRIEVLAENRA